jgi:hypothetical protein
MLAATALRPTKVVDAESNVKLRYWESADCVAAATFLAAQKRWPA